MLKNRLKKLKERRIWMKRGKLIYKDGFSVSSKIYFFLFLNVPWLIMGQQLFEQLKEDPVDLITSLVAYNLFLSLFTIPWGRHYYLYEQGIACKKLGKCLRFEPYETVQVIEGLHRSRRHKGGSLHHYYGLIFWFSDATYMDIEIGSISDVEEVWSQLITLHPELIKKVTYDKQSCYAKEIYQKLMDCEVGGCRCG